MVVAHKSNTEEIGILRKVFQSYDTNKSGDITYEEFVNALSSTGFTDEQLRPIFDSVVRRIALLLVAAWHGTLAQNNLLTCLLTCLYSIRILMALATFVTLNFLQVSWVGCRLFATGCLRECHFSSESLTY